MSRLPFGRALDGKPPRNESATLGLGGEKMGGSGPGSKPRQGRPQGSNVSRGSGGDPCDISFVTPLAHVRTAQTSNLRIGTVLDVDVEPVANKRTIVCRRRRDREIVGFVLARGASQLIDCIEQGNLYIAEITKMDFAHIEVVVRRSS